MSDWARTANTTIRKYIKGSEQAVLRKRAVFPLLKQKGRIIYDDTGDDFDWKVQFALPDVTADNGEGLVTANRKNLWQTAYLGWRGYKTTELFTKRERLKNGGKEAIIKVVDEIGKNLQRAISEQFSNELYVDGNATGNDDRLHGIESFMGTNGTVTVTTGAAHTAAVADFAAYPNDTYANLTTGLGDYGGSQTSGIWPEGTADPQYDYFSPIMINYPSSFYSSTATWAANAILALRHGILLGQRNVGPEGSVDTIVLDQKLWREFLALEESKERVMVTGKDVGLRQWGFNTVMFDGCELLWEYGVPRGQGGATSGTAAGYGFNTDMMELRSAQSDLFVMDDAYDFDLRSDKYIVDFIGNLRFLSPRNFVKWASYATS